MKVLKFQMYFKGLTTKNNNLEFQKILIECEWLKKLFICKWDKTTRNGTRAKFMLTTEEEAIKRSEELMQKVNVLKHNR